MSAAHSLYLTLSKTKRYEKINDGRGSGLDPAYRELFNW